MSTQWAGKLRRIRSMLVGRTVGIDLGTTNSCLAVIEEGKPRIIPNAEGERITPSVVSFLESGDILVGSKAKRQAVLSPARTIFSAKRFIGRTFEDVIPDIHRFPFKIEEREDGGVQFNLGEKKVTPEDVAAIILQKLVRDAETALGEKIEQAVITVPAYFTESQRQTTKLAGQIAGLDVLRIINEPTAASLNYALKEKDKVVVFDIGGGTVDVSILEIDQTLFEVRSTSGDTHLGGDDFDNILIDLLVRQSAKIAPLLSDRIAMQRIREAAEAAKIQLSTLVEAEVSLPFLFPDSVESRNFAAVITRGEFEELAHPLIERCREPIRQALIGANIPAGEISKVLLVGGAGRMPIIKALLSLEFPKREIVAPSNTEEIVALGAAIQGGILNGEINNQLLMDVTPFALGIEVEGGKFLPMIHANSPIPTRAIELFTTASHFQRGADIKILQRESVLTTPKHLGTFSLEGFKSPVKGGTEVAVVFEIDESGMLTVSATDTDTNRSNQISVKTEGASQETVSKAQAEVSNYNAQAEVADLIKKAEYLAEQLIRVAAATGERNRQFRKCQDLQEKLKGAAESRSEKRLKATSKEAEKFLASV